MTQAMTCCGITCCKGSTDRSRSLLDARVSQKDIGAVYDKLSKVYDLWSMLTESRARARAIELAGIKDGQTILEAAVGTGHAFQELVKRNPRGRNIGIDLSDGMLAKAKKRMAQVPGAQYTLAKGTAFDLPAADGTVDLLMNNYMFDLIAYDDMDKVLAEFRRVLNKGGKLVLVNMTEGESLWTKIYDLIYRLYPKAIGGCRGVKLTEKLKEQGFTVVTREYYHQLLFPSEVIVAYAKNGDKE
jgi:ubiquinone/menaquinone biosynthesis C-methylase UbiE